MSQTDELLDNLSEEEIQAYSGDSETEPHIVIGRDRIIMVPEVLKRLAVQYDHNVETVTFDCIRYWDGLDMSAMPIYINYKRADGELGSYLVEDVTVDETDNTIMHFTWTISGHVSYRNGNLIFLVCAKRVDENGLELNHWNSELCMDCYISPGMEHSTSVIEANTDIITQLLTRMDTAENAVYTADVTAALKQYEDTKAMLDEGMDSLDKLMDESEKTRQQLINTVNEAQTNLDNTLDEYKALVDRTSIALSKKITEFRGTYDVVVEGNNYGSFSIEGYVESNGVHGVLYIDSFSTTSLSISLPVQDHNRWSGVKLATVDPAQVPFSSVFFDWECPSTHPTEGSFTTILRFILASSGDLILYVNIKEPNTPFWLYDHTFTEFMRMYPLNVRYGVPSGQEVSNEVTEGDTRPITSDAVFRYIAEVLGQS